MMLTKHTLFRSHRALYCVVLMAVLLTPVLTGCATTTTTTLPPATVVSSSAEPTAVLVVPQVPTLTPEPSQSGSETEAGQPFTVMIVHTNDVAGYMLPCG